MPSFLHSGDAGDAIYALPTIRALGGGLLYFDSRPWTRSRFTPNLLLTLKPLLEAQDAIEEVRLHTGEKFDYDLSTFRNGGYKLGDTIVERQRRWLCAPSLDLSKPWLKVEPDCAFSHKVAVNRAPRWLGFHFPWKVVADQLRDKMVFLGLPEEHKSFVNEFGKIDFEPTRDFLEAAQIIAGSAFFIGNQSACNAIANGLHKPTLLEVCPYAPDCYLPRENAIYTIDGGFDCEILGVSLVCPPYHPRSGWYIEVKGKRFYSDTEIHALILAKAEYSRRLLPLPEEELTAIRYSEAQLEFV
jgi:hypothetical protein